MKKNTKFGIGISVIVLTIIYLGISGIQQDLSYYMTVDEFLIEISKPNVQAYDKTYRIAGQVVIGSIDRDRSPMTFEINNNDKTIMVAYIGTSPIPDTFQDRALAVIAGKMSPSGVFQGDKIQAKCASKYEAMTEIGQTNY